MYITAKTEKMAISKKDNDMTVGITFSSFDLFHSGHVAMLKEASEHCNYLIVGLQTDPTIDRPEKNKPIQSVFERYVRTLFENVLKTF